MVSKQEESPNQKDANENKENTNSNCSSQANNTWYWVGKESLRLWSSLALKKFESQLPFNKSIDQLGTEYQ